MEKLCSDKERSELCVYFQKQLCANETGTDNTKLFILEDLVLSFFKEIAGYRCLD